jgi:hypothetical protein
LTITPLQTKIFDHIAMTDSAADAACEILEIIRSASLSKTSPAEEKMLSKRVWAVLCRQPSDVDSKLGVRIV